MIFADMFNGCIFILWWSVKIWKFISGFHAGGYVDILNMSLIQLYQLQKREGATIWK